MKKRALICLACLFIFFQLAHPFLFAEEVEVSSVRTEEMKKRLGQAEAFYAQGEYSRAKDLYIDLYKQSVEYGVEERTISNLQLRIVFSYFQMDRLDDAQALVEKFLSEQFSEEFILKGKIVLSKIFKKKGMIQKSYISLLEAESMVSTSRWRGEDQQYFRSVQTEINCYIEGLLKNGERLFNAALYAEAAPLYEEVIDLIKSGCYPKILRSRKPADGEVAPKILLRLAQSLFLSGDYSRTITVLKDDDPRISGRYTKPSSSLKETHRNGLYLLGLAEQKSGKFQEAIGTFKKYLEVADRLSLSHYDDVQYQLGYTYFKVGNLREAKSYLTSLTQVIPNRKVYLLSQLYLARIDMKEGSFDEASEKLHHVEKLISKSDPLNFEIAFLRGKIAFQLKDYTSSAKEFEFSLPNRERQRADWVNEALYHLGWSYLKLADSSEIHQSEKKALFNDAEKTLSLLVDQAEEEGMMEKGVLALAQCLLRKGVSLEDRRSYSQLEKLLTSTEALKSLDGKAQALVLLGEVTEGYSRREEIYKELTGKPFVMSRLYGQGWYLRGLNHYTEGRRRIDEGKEDNGILTLAAENLNKAYQRLTKVSSIQAIKAHLLQAESLYYSGKKESLEEAFQIYDSIIKKHIAEVKDLDDPAKVFYFYGLTAGRLAEFEKEDFYHRNAEEAMFHVVTTYLNSSYRERALDFIGKQYFDLGKHAQAEQIFVKLQSEHPKSTFASHALFWAAECADWQNKGREISKGYRQKLVELYPSSLVADEAYFNYYTFHEYLQCGEEEITHLERMEKLYPDSPFLTTTYYLLGLHAKNRRNDVDEPVQKTKVFEKAIAYFEKAQDHFSNTFVKGKISEESRKYFLNIYCRSAIERSQALLLIAELSTGAKKRIYLDYAEKGFTQIIEEYVDEKSPYQMDFAHDHLFLTIRNESFYGLSQVYQKEEKTDLSEKVLSEMLQLFAEEDLQRGYLLSRVWYDLGLLTLGKGDASLALKFFHRAEEAEKGGLLSTEQRLDLWIQQSFCCRKNNELDTAMALLSKVINDPAISSKRLQAMYLRAEIYEEQGRHELAVKQLEATSKKGGDWALKAKDRLEKDYGIHE